MDTLRTKSTHQRHVVVVAMLSLHRLWVLCESGVRSPKAGASGAVCRQPYSHLLETRARDEEKSRGKLLPRALTCPSFELMSAPRGRGGQRQVQGGALSLQSLTNCQLFDPHDGARVEPKHKPRERHAKHHQQQQEQPPPRSDPPVTIRKRSPPPSQEPAPMLFVAPLNVPDRARLVDERGNLCEEGKLLLLELPTNFLVVGCVGLEGSGKSTIMSSFFHGVVSPLSSHFYSLNKLFSTNQQAEHRVTCLHRSIARLQTWTPRASIWP